MRAKPVILPWHHPQWTRMGAEMETRSHGEGLPFFRRMVHAAAERPLVP